MHTSQKQVSQYGSMTANLRLVLGACPDNVQLEGLMNLLHATIVNQEPLPGVMVHLGGSQVACPSLAGCRLQPMCVRWASAQSLVFYEREFPFEGVPSICLPSNIN